MAKATIIDRTSAAPTSSPPPGTQQPAPKPEPEPLRPPPPRRKKVPFEKGFSQMDWMRLTKDKSKDLNGLAGAPLRKHIPLSEVQLHSTADDAWTVIHNKVYNMTPYLSFHPGGVDYLIKVAGKDGTALFNKYHPWVNIDFMLQRCMIGHLDNNNINNATNRNGGGGEKKGVDERMIAARPIDIDMTSSGDGHDKTTTSPPLGPASSSSSSPPTMLNRSSIDKANAELIAKGAMEMISRSQTPEEEEEEENDDDMK
jgi:cytochrome b involved in lipid metabolism